MIVSTFKHYQDQACEAAANLDISYWSRVLECLHEGAEPEGWDEQGQPLYSVDDLIRAERTANALLH